MVKATVKTCKMFKVVSWKILIFWDRTFVLQRVDMESRPLHDACCCSRWRTLVCNSVRYVRTRCQSTRASTSVVRGFLSSSTRATVGRCIVDLHELPSLAWTSRKRCALMRTVSVTLVLVLGRESPSVPSRVGHPLTTSITVLFCRYGHN